MLTFSYDLIKINKLINQLEGVNPSSAHVLKCRKEINPSCCSMYLLVIGWNIHCWYPET